MMRTAISPRLATSTEPNISAGTQSASSAQQLASDDQLADLGGARADLPQLARAIEPVDLGLPDVARAAVDLQRLVGDRGKRPAGAEDDGGGALGHLPTSAAVGEAGELGTDVV